MNSEPLAAGRADQLPGLWTDAIVQVGSVLRAKVDEGFHAALESAATPLAGLIERDPDLAIIQVVRFEEPQTGAGNYAGRHAVHAGIAALLAAQRLGWDSQTCAWLLRAALTMHLAIAELQDRLAMQASPLTELQRQAIRSHPQRSADLLRAGGVTCSDWIEAVARHHEPHDGSGIRHGAGGAGELALMLSRVDDFTAKFAARSMRPALTADKAVRQFQQARPNDPLTAAIVAEFGIYPPGCAVRLRSGEIGVVMRRGASPATPLVVAVRAPGGDALPTPLRRDTAGRPEHTIASVVSAAAVRVRLPLARLVAACDG